MSFFFNFILCISILDSNTQSSDIYTLSTNSGSENSKASSSDTSPALRNSGNQSRLSASSRPTSERNSSNNPKCVSEGSASPLGHSSYSATTAGDICADNQTVINLGTFWHHIMTQLLNSINRRFFRFRCQQNIKFVESSGITAMGHTEPFMYCRHIWHYRHATN